MVLMKVDGTKLPKDASINWGPPTSTIFQALIIDTLIFLSCVESRKLQGA